MRVLVCRVVDYRRRVEHHHVGLHALPEQAAVAQAEPVGDGGAALAHRVLQRQPAEVAHVVPDHPRVGAVGAGVGEAALARFLRIDPAGVGAELHPWLLRLQPEVFLAHREEDGEDVAFLALDDVEHGFLPVHAQLIGDLRQSLALQVPVLFLAEGRDDHVLRASLAAQILPVAGRVAHLLEDLRPHLRITKVLDQLPVLLRPRREADGDPGASTVVGVHVGGDVDAPRPRGVDPLDHLGHLVPVLGT